MSRLLVCAGLAWITGLYFYWLTGAEDKGSALLATMITFMYLESRDG